MTAIREFLTENWARLQQAALFHPSVNDTFGNPEFTHASCRVLIVRLSPFRDVERSTPHLFLFQAVRRVLPDAFIDMAFFPPQHDRERFLTHHIPLLTGTQSWRGPEDFDVILISNAYTLELINLPYLFIHSDLPVMAGDRNENHPLIILGGSNAQATQSIINSDGDSVVDAIFFGEGEREVESLIRHLAHDRSTPKRERLQRAAHAVTGLWTANQPLNTPVEKAHCTAPQAVDLLTNYPLLNGEESDTARMQITLGCPAFCSFCFEGFDRKPYRELTLKDVWTTAVAIKKEMGPATLDLVSFNFNTYAGILPLLLKLSRLYNRVSFKSQRVDILAAMPSMLDAELAAGKRSYTVGIEGISQRLRVFLHKSLSDGEIDNLISRLLHLKVREIKLFYILTGHETPSDIAEFRYFLRDLKNLRSGTKHGVRVVFSFGLLIRMPFTPLRYDRLFLDEQEWRDITGQVKSACETNGFEFRLATPWQDYATSQVLALGGYWLCDPLLALATKGYFYDTELAEGYWSALKDWMQKNGYWTADFLDEKGADTVFPLEFLEQRISNGFLYQLYDKAKTGVDDGYCLGEIGQPMDESPDAHCFGCGACTTVEERAAITQHTMQQPGATYLTELSQTMDSKRHMKPLYAHMWLPPETVGKTPAWLNAWVMRALLQAMPNQVENITLVRESVFGTKENIRRYTGLFGETVFSIYAWDVEALTAGLALTTSHIEGVRFMRWLNDFTPGTFQRAGLSITLPARHFPNAGQQLRRYLQDQYVPVNLRRTEEGYAFDISKKALQKRIVYAGNFSETRTTYYSHLVVSTKFNLLAYLQSFADPYWVNEAMVEVSDLEI